MTRSGGQALFKIKLAAMNKTPEPAEMNLIQNLGVLGLRFLRRS